MNILIFAENELVSPNKLSITGEKARHLRRERAVARGDRIKVGQLEGQLGSGVVLEAEKDSLLVEFELATESAPLLPIALVLAMPRPRMLRRILQFCAALGLAKIVLLMSSRCEKSFFHSSLLEEKNLEAELIKGLEQSIATRLPQVCVCRSFRKFTERDLLSPLLAEREIRLLAHPSAAKDLTQVSPRCSDRAFCLAIGPEAGWSEEEVSIFEQREFKSFSLGPRQLRVESAVSYLLGQINLLRESSSPFKTAANL